MKIIVYRNYRFMDKDPVIDAQATILKDEGLSEYEASQITGVAMSTLKGWFRGGTRRPNNATATQNAAALGYVRRDELKADGQVIVGYVKARKIDPVEEREKMANWILRQRGPRPKRRARKKKNGGA
jgi:hypothetical protein